MGVFLLSNLQKEVIKIIRTLNLNRETTAILENAYAISYEREVNALWYATFSLPIDDPKVDKVELLKYVEIDDVGLFRIIPKLTSKSSNSVTFECEHVLAILLGKSLFKYHQQSNFTTKQNIEYLLDQQHHKHWILGTCEFTRYFSYAWENENLLSALFSIPNNFNEQYEWTWDTSSYPWKLNLVKPDTKPTCRIKEGYNLIDFDIEENPMSVFNRIYPLGAGEGVNQLTIESINNGVPYLEDVSSGEEIIEKIWSDQRFTDVESLMSSAQAQLDKWKKPIATWRTTAADVSSITGLDIDKFELGKVVRIQLDNYPTVDLRIMKETHSDLTGNPADVGLEISNVQEDLGTTNADLERRQQINELYAQGATNILNFTYQDNCDDNIPASIPFFIDDDVVNVNTVELTFDTKKFRAYSETTKSAGQIITSVVTGGGGDIIKKETTATGGQSVQGTTTTSSDQSAQTSAAGGNHRHLVFGYVGDIPDTTPDGNWHQYTAPANSDGTGASAVFLAGAGHPIYTEGGSGDHTHRFNTPGHTYGVSFTIPGHSHAFEFTLPNHSHPLNLNIPGHQHGVEHKIVELNTLPSQVTIKVDGNRVPHTAITGGRVNLVDYMTKDSSGKVTRGNHEVTILPDKMGRIEANLILRVFIQSQLGGNF